MLVFSPEYGEFNGSFNYFLTSFENHMDYLYAKASTNTETAQNAIYHPPEKNSYSSVVGSEPQSITFGYKYGYALYITSYTLRSSGAVSNSNGHLRSWNLLGSLDGVSWDVIDSQTNFELLNGALLYVNIPCKENLYKHFRINQTGVGFGSRYGFSLNKIDFFGILVSNYRPKIYSCFCNSTTKDNLIITYILLLLF